jgi:rSAM/selenodomain-associated transferase 1
MADVLLVFAKVPRPGDVKTRLTPALTPDEAARLYEAFLTDALQQYLDLPVEVRLCVPPPLPRDAWDLVPDGVPVVAQRGASLGERMQNAFDDALADADRVCIVGTDHPTLPTAYLRKAFEVLDADASICIGPSEDGGFYVLGMSTFYPVLFEDMTYSHDQVFHDTLARVDQTPARLTVLPRWYDVDTPSSLRRLVGDLEDAEADLSATRAVVRDLRLGALLS